ncbi:hypothetical protein MPSEU_000311500 [Mayamaea pseudoterrestris]|nr:hypothetical protein MPSEU_000311500 [Mayamaea pseudoterrestris]
MAKSKAAAARGGAAQQQLANAATKRGILIDHTNREDAPTSQRIKKDQPTLRRSKRLLQQGTLSVLETSAAPPVPQKKPTKRNTSTKASEREQRTKRARSRSADVLVERPTKVARHAVQDEARRITRSRLISQERCTADLTSAPILQSRSSDIRSVGVVSIDDSTCGNFMKQDDHNLCIQPFNPCLLTRAIAPHDLLNANNILEVPEYVTDIYQRLFAAEDTFRVRPYLNDTDQINGTVRKILIDWIVQLQNKFNCVDETLHLAINILDRYLSHVQVARTRVQLIGVAALWIASKYEDIYPPEAKEFVYMCDRAYSHQDVLDAEREILKVLQFRISSPTAYPFMCRFLNMMQIELKSAIWFSAHYYLDRMLEEPEFLNYQPSLIALAATVLALNNAALRKFDKLDDESPGMVRLIGYE